MGAHNCENCGQRVEPGSGVTTSRIGIFQGEVHYFCCKRCRDAAIKDGTVKEHSNGCMVFLYLVVAAIFFAILIAANR